MLFETFGDFYAYCQSASKHFVDKVLTPHIVRRFIRRAQWDVYNFYTPHQYIRRFTLSNPKLYTQRIEKDSGLKGVGEYYYNIFTYSASNTAIIVERGRPYAHAWYKDGVKNPPRPFGANTVKQLMGDMPAIEKAYKDQLARYRIETF